MEAYAYPSGYGPRPGLELKTGVEDRRVARGQVDEQSRYASVAVEWEVWLAEKMGCGSGPGAVCRNVPSSRWVHTGGLKYLRACFRGDPCPLKWVCSWGQTPPELQFGPAKTTETNPKTAHGNPRSKPFRWHVIWR